MANLRFRPLFVVTTLLIASLATRADAAGGRVRGSVTDQTGAALVGATVRITDLNSGAASSTSTGALGQYLVDGVPPGRYQVAAEASGFETAVRGNITVAGGDDVIVDLELVIARQQAVVDVTALAQAEPEQIAPEQARTSDSASLLDGRPGVSLWRSGGVSSVPALHGLADDRVKVTLDGMAVDPACSNHMNPPLSNVAPSSIGTISVLAGITPVSRGGDSIGGSVIVETLRPDFAKAGEGLRAKASVSLYGRSNSGNFGASASVSAASEHVRVGYTGSYVTADNYTAGSDVEVKSTLYQASNHAVQVAVSQGGQTLTGDVGLQRIPEQGFANARMDMTSNDAAFANLHYGRMFSSGRLDARVYYQRTRHQMNILRDKSPGMNMPMNTDGVNLGYSLGGERGLSTRDVLRIGTELHRFQVDDWWPPAMNMVGSMGPDPLLNVNDGRRTRVGTWAEWESKRGSVLTTVVGVRSDIVLMDTGNVAGYNMSTTTTGSAAYYADASEFNARDHARRDNNVDATLLVRAEPSSVASIELAYARKTRSPNLYERYLWVKRSNMSVQMNGWFGDANGYTGNLDLRPEVGHTLSATVGWHDAGKRDRELTVTPYYTFVSDYIDVDRCPVIPGSNGCTAAKLVATTGFVNLQFMNHDARLYGVDVSGRLPLGGSQTSGAFSLAAVVNYVGGRIVDTGDSVYHLMPLDARLTLEHRRGRWSSMAGVQAITAKDGVQAVRIELPTPGYVLVNLRTSYEWGQLRLDVGLDNATDRAYLLPVGGRYWVGDKTGASSVPGVGRSLFAGLTVKL
jgi:iron complex outermembrane recepter protein